MKAGVIELYTKVRKLYDNHGNLTGYILINMDNTERIDALKRILDLSNLFLLISDYAKVGYAKLNLLNRQAMPSSNGSRIWERMRIHLFPM